MPIKECTINNEKGYKWGDEGKCYVGKDAKEKAYKQGIAIGEYTQYDKTTEKINEFREALAIRKVSFDYDGTLTQANVQDIVKRLLTSKATKIYIISARHNVYGMYALAKKLGIPVSNIYATGSNKAKIEKIKQLQIDKHYDNNKDVIDALGNIGELI